MFAEVDVDGSGAIDAGELRGLLQKMGVYLTARELELAVLSIDKDGSVSTDSQMPNPLARIEKCSDIVPICCLVCRGRLNSKNSMPGGLRVDWMQAVTMKE